MAQITRNNINSFCRTCLKELQWQFEEAQSTVVTAASYHVHKLQGLSQLLVLITSQVVNKEDKYPKYVCQICFHQLKMLKKFRNKSLQSIHILNDVLSDKAQGEIKDGTLLEEYTLSEKSKTEQEENRDWLKFSYKNKQFVTKQKMEINNPLEAETKNSITTVLETNQNDFLAHTGINIERIIENSDMDKVNKEANTKQELISFFEQEGEIKTEHAFDTAIEIRNLSVKDDIDEEEFVDIDNNDIERLVEIAIESNDSNSSSDEPISAIKLKLFVEPVSTNDISKIDIPAVKRETRRKDATREKEKCCKKFEIKHQCELCPRRFINQENLDAHLRTHQGLKPFQCTQCERGYGKRSRLRQHIREKHCEIKDEMKIICTYEGCGKIFQRDGSYKMHYRLKHSDSKPIWKTYICEECGRSFKNLTMLREHHYTHRSPEEYPYKCEQCGKHYTSRRIYKEHLLRHAGIKNFECPHCGMKKTTRNELRTHINYHTKEKQWQCPLCPSIFNSSANLGMHNRIVHKGIRRFACRFCNQSFGKPDTLKHHEMRHTGEKPHACNVCNKRFIQAVALRTHMKTHSKDVDKTKKFVKKLPNQLQTHADDESNSKAEVVEDFNIY